MLKIWIFVLMFACSQTSIAVEEEQISIENLEIPEEEPAENDDNFRHNKNYAKIQILNKITAKTNYLNIKVGSEILFDSLKIKALSCWKSSPYDLSENKILLDIEDKKINTEEYHKIFAGWMFSSSPAIASIEHPIYDIVAIDCHD